MCITDMINSSRIFPRPVVWECTACGNSCSIRELVRPIGGNLSLAPDVGPVLRSWRFVNSAPLSWINANIDNKSDPELATGLHTLTHAANHSFIC